MIKFVMIFLFSCSLIFPQGLPLPQEVIARNDLFNNRMFPAYDSQGKMHLSYTGQLGTNSNTREIYYVKEDNGTFTTINITNNSVDDNYSSLSVDLNDKVHIGYIGRDPSNLFQVKYTNNISGTFFEPIYITQGGLNKATPYTKIGPDSVMHFVYFTFTNDPDNVYYRSYDLRTSTLSNEVFLSGGETSGDFDAALDVDNNGKVHIILKAGSAFGGQLRYFTNASGSMQEVSTGVTATVVQPKVLAGINNEIYILYRNEADRILNVIHNKTGSFGTPVQISPPGQRPAFYQNFSQDSTGRLYFVWQSSVTTSNRGFYMVYGENDIYSDTLLVWELTPDYLLRNSNAIIAKGNGDFAVFYAPSASRDGQVVCDIFMKRGNLFEVIPVELKNFSASVEANSVLLKWSTITEKNNLGFEIERASFSKNETTPIKRWETIGFVEGRGTITEEQFYSFSDLNLQPDNYTYRLKQIDFDGSYSYSNVIEIEITQPDYFTLYQNYPNPFNPTTKIKFSIQSGVESSSRTSLRVYDILGNEIVTLVNETKVPGHYEVEFDAYNLSSGIYFFTLKAGEFISTKKMTLVK